MALAEILAGLYQTQEDARRILDEAGLHAMRIDLQGPMINVWHDVLREARRGGTLIELMRIPLREYVTNDALWSAWVADQIQQQRAKTSDGERVVDERDERELNRVRDSVHTLSGRLGELQLTSDVRYERNSMWQKHVDERFDSLEESQDKLRLEVESLKQGLLALQSLQQLYVSPRTFWLALLVAAVLFSIIVGVMLMFVR